MSLMAESYFLPSLPGLTSFLQSVTLLISGARLGHHVSIAWILLLGEATAPTTEKGECFLLPQNVVYVSELRRAK